MNACAAPHRRLAAASGLAAIVVTGCADPTGGTASSTAAPPAAEAPPPVNVFVDAAENSGLDFVHVTGATGEFYFPEIMGAGVAVFDFDDDGDLDVYAVQSEDLPGASTRGGASLHPRPPGQPPGSRLYRNELLPSGNLAFVDVTDEANAGVDGYGMGVATGDYDNDGDVDLYVSRYGGGVLLENLGDGRFAEATRAAGIEDSGWGTSAAFADVDIDGDLDLYLARYVSFTPGNNVRCTSAAGQRDYCDPTTYRPMIDALWRNDGNGRFTDVTVGAGLDRIYGNGLGVTVADFDGDALPDIYVANDKLANQLWINAGDGTFADTALMSGAAYNADGVAEASMGVTAGDIDADGDEDLFMTHLDGQTNTLYLNDGDGNFIDETDRFGLGVASLRFTGFGAAWFDYDNDGRLDAFVANGAVIVEPAQLGKSAWPYAQPNQLFRQGPDGVFRDVGAAMGAAMGLTEVSRGAAFGDIDNDGDADIVVSNNNGPLRLMINQVGNARPWLRIRLVGTRSNRDGLGARVAVLRDGQAPLWRRAHTDGSYLSASDRRVLVGLGDKTPVAGIAVAWPSGLTERFDAGALRRELRLVEGDGSRWSP